MNSTTPAGTVQISPSVYSDPDGWQNIAAANFYLSGNGGTHNEWLHYLAAPNLFTMMGTNDVCNPGQATTLSNGFLTLNCATSSVSGSGTVLTVTFRVTPQAPSSGINYNIFTAVSDQAGAATAYSQGPGRYSEVDIPKLNSFTKAESSLKDVLALMTWAYFFR